MAIWPENRWLTLQLLTSFSRFRILTRKFLVISAKTTFVFVGTVPMGGRKLRTFELLAFDE